MAPKKPTKTGGQAGGRAGRPSGPIAGTKDKTARVPSSWNARSVDPTNQRGAGQRITGGLAGGRAGKPAGKIAGQAPKPASTPKTGVKVPAEWNAKTIYSGANKPRPGAPTTTAGRMAARGPLNAPGAPALPNSTARNINLVKFGAGSMRSRTPDVRPSNKPVAKPTAKPAAPAKKPTAKPTATTPRVRTTTSYGPPSSKVKFAGASQSNPLSGIRSAATNAVNTVKNAASQAGKSGVGKNLARLANNPAAKGYGKPGKVEAGIRRAAGMGMTAARIARGVTPAGVAYETLKPRPTADGTLAGKGMGRFANARNMAFAKAKGIKGSPVLGPKKVGTGKVVTIAQAFDRSFAAARKAGKATFMFRGKKYTTEMA